MNVGKDRQCWGGGEGEVAVTGTRQGLVVALCKQGKGGQLHSNLCNYYNYYFIRRLSIFDLKWGR